MKKGELTRQSIIRAAAPVFNKLGYGAASLADLMEATGLEKGGIYRHFESKEQLACEAFDYAFACAYEAKITPVLALGTGLAKISGFIDGFVANKSPIAGGCPVYNTAVEHDDGNPALKKRALKAYQRWVADLASFVTEAKAEGSLRRDVDAKSVATFLLAALEGSLIAKNLTGKTAALEAARTQLRVYLQGLEA